ncbi:MAG: acetate/propionate family kinase [Chitinophagales bacterium]|nr:acetate/propionate family kinase [Chitinophagales bacterium]
MQILVVNCGSSSIKLEIIDTYTKTAIHQLNANHIGNIEFNIAINNQEIDCNENDYSNILQFCIKTITKRENINILGVGHRVVHGGTKYFQPTIIDETVEATIESLIPLAPLHNPVNLEGIKIAKQIFPDLIHVAVFDTAFHQSLPNRAKQYALPTSLVEKYQIYRYGFHGTSHKYVSEQAAKFLNMDIKGLRMISCHLGNGASACAVEYGRSVETSMGFTALEGLVMGTRSGDIDAGILFYLAQQENISIKELEDIVYKESGLKGLSNLSNNMKAILDAAQNGDDNCRKAIQVFSHRLKKYIGAYAAIMGGLDVLIFTGGIGENAKEIRHRVCEQLGFIGIIIDEDKNCDAKLSNQQKVIEIEAINSKVKILVIATDEELAIAEEASKIVNEKNKVNNNLSIPIAISARHVHLTRATLDILYGKDYELTVKKPLSQPRQFAANETVTLIGVKNNIENVRILGPLRSKDQVEISRTDEFFLGIDAPVRESGHTENTPGITLEGPKGKVKIKEGLICAWRHIHMHPDDAKAFGVKDQDVVSVDINDESRALTFHNVIIRVSDKFKLEMHIDTDEGNAAEITNGEEGVLIPTNQTACLVKKNV